MTGPGLQPIPRILDLPAPRDTKEGLQPIGGGEISKGGLQPIPASTVQQRLDDPHDGLVKSMIRRRVDEKETGTLLCAVPQSNGP